MAAEAPIDQAARRGSPLRAFLITASIFIAASAAVWLMSVRPDNDVSTDSPRVFPSHADVVQAFLDLDERRHRAFQALDVQAIRAIYTSQSPAVDKVVESIKRLREDGVIPAESVDRRSTAVLHLSGNEAVIRDVILYSLRFTVAEGTDISNERVVERQVLHWTLRRVGASWAIHDVQIAAAEVVDK